MYNDLFKYPNVVGAGIGYMSKQGERHSEGVVVMVSEKKPLFALAEHEVIPDAFKGINTDVLEVGKIVAPRPPLETIKEVTVHLEEVDRTDVWRPAPGGVSIGHYSITAGTLGCICYDVQTGNNVILSNNHVLANSNNAKVGDRILQPGPHDGGEYDKDMIATLSRFVPIVFGEDDSTCPISNFTAKVLNFLARAFGSEHQLKPVRTSQEANKVDAAIAVPINSNIVSNHILEIPVIPSETVRPTLGMKVTKSGRTTGTTESEIIVVDATVNVDYGGKYAKFENQFVTGPMSKGGDSGSLILTADDYKAVGLLFAGSNQVTIGNKIQNVFDALNISF